MYSVRHHFIIRRRVEFILCTHEAFILAGSFLWLGNVSFPRRARIFLRASERAGESEKFLLRLFTTNANFTMRKAFDMKKETLKNLVKW